MPALGADMEAGTLVRWRKQPGERVKRGEIMAEVETEKGVIEVESFSEGVVAAQHVSPGTKVPVQTLLATISQLEAAPGAAPKVAPPVVPSIEPSNQPAAPLTPPTAPPRHAPEALPAMQVPPLHATPAARKLLREFGMAPRDVPGTGSHGSITRQDVVTAAQQAAPPEQPQAAGDGRVPSHTGASFGPQAPAGRIVASPRARRLAEARAISLDALTGTGPSGSIVAADVERAVRTAAAPESGDGRARMRRAIAQAMTHSKREIPHYYLSHVVDLGPVLAWLSLENEQRRPSERLLAGTLFVRAVALAARQIPELNGQYVDEQLHISREVHVGVAVSLRGGGLVAPAIANTDRLSLDELSAAFKDVVNRARTGMLRSSEMSLPTITVTSLGERGVETVYPIIIPPQVAMVGFGTIVERPMVVAHAVVPRPTVTVTLAADHRVSDGHRGGLFLAAVCNLLKEPLIHEARRTPPRDLPEPRSDRA
jgi:pyruvate dehydrogenase E2 component (dihydrolipoamide acetyltransferase)